MSYTNSSSNYQPGSAHEASTSHIVSRALSCIQGTIESTFDLRSALDAVIRLFLEEYRNRSRNDDIPQLDLRFGRITAKLLLDDLGPLYAPPESSPNIWFHDFLCEHAKALSELIGLQHREDLAAGPEENGDHVVFYERMRYLDTMALLASVPAPVCVICREVLFYSCITCHHCCVSDHLSDPHKRVPAAATTRKAKRRRTSEKTEHLPSPNEEEDKGSSVPIPSRVSVPPPIPDVHIHPPSLSPPISEATESHDPAPVNSIPESIELAPPSTETVGGDLSSISSDVSSRSPAILTEAEMTSKTDLRPERQDGRLGKRRAGTKASPDPSVSSSKRSAPTTNAMRLTRIPENRPKRNAVREETPARSQLGTAMVCVNCRPRFSCALQSGCCVEGDRPRACGGLILLSRFSLSQIALLMVLLIDKLKGPSSKWGPWDLFQTESLRPLTNSTNQTITASLIRHIHRFPRLVDLADLCKTLTHRLFRWDDHVACHLLGEEIELATAGGSMSTVGNRITAYKEAEVSSSSSEETAVLRQQSSASSSSAESQASFAHGSEDPGLGSVNESSMDRLSVHGAELLSHLSWAYLCAASRATFREMSPPLAFATTENEATLRNRTLEALNRVLLHVPTTQQAVIRKRRIQTAAD